MEYSIKIKINTRVMEFTLNRLKGLMTPVGNNYRQESIFLQIKLMDKIDEDR
jgi:hypothetical protein